MLNAPVPATRKVCAKAGMSSVTSTCSRSTKPSPCVPEKYIRDLDLDREKINVNGGAIALGLPIGPTGRCWWVRHLTSSNGEDKQIGLITMCAGGGMAPAIIERVWSCRHGGR